MAVIGPNGAGKTTLFNLIHGELPADDGNVRFEGHEILGLSSHEIARRGVGRTFQVAATFASMTVRESLALALAAYKGIDGAMVAGMLPVHVSRVHELLARSRLDGLADAHCAALAYGDSKRLELALALAREPRLLLMDEPTAGMTPRSRRELMQLVVDLSRANNVAVLFTEHDMDIVFGFAQHVIVLDSGAMIAHGSPADMRSNKTVRAAYLG